MAFFVIIPLTLSKNNKAKYIYIFVLVAVIAVTLALRFMSFLPLNRVGVGEFVYWLRPADAKIMVSFILGGIMLFLQLIWSGISFITYGLKNRQKSYVFKRSILLGSGTTMLGLTAGINYVIGSVPKPQSLLVASLISIFSLLLVMFGALLKEKDYEI